tara:strand:+ start:319 stop:2454 length:2136 start_codon:yes stop_codon:yes gene_type:complete
MKNKKIAVLLPFKDHFTRSNAGSASIWIKDFNKRSIYKNDIKIYGNTDNLKDVIDKKNYTNINFNSYPFQGKNISYVDKFIKLIKKDNFSLIEIHNRPSYVHYLLKNNVSTKIVLIFHNNPLALGGSKSISERKELLNICEKLIFVSNWVMEKFFEGLDRKSNNKCKVIYPSIQPIKKFPNKKNIISFVGKLNKSKGFHLFGNVIVKILNKYNNWKGIIVGDEPREKYNFKHKNLKYMGWISHEKTLDLYAQTSISVAPSFWDEPFGRTSMEAASRGCATIISKKGGLIETVPNAIYLSNLDSKNLYSKIEDLIKNKNKRFQLQKSSFKKVFHNLNVNTKTIDSYRNEIFTNIKFTIPKKSKLKIIHISNFGNRLFNRLYFISIAKKISNGLIRLGHDVVNISDRDTIRFNRSVSAKTGISYLNKLFIETVKNYLPDLIILGHSDNLNIATFEQIKKLKKDVKIIQWFEDNLHLSGPDPLLNQERLIKYSSVIDHNFITTHPSALKFIKNNKKYSYMPIPVDKNIERLNIYENKTPIYDLFFTMSHGVNRGVLKTDKTDERYPFVEKLLKKNPDIIFDIYGYKNRQPIWSEDFYYCINKSKMGLNLSRTNSVKYYSSNRISSLIGNGLMTFIDIKTQLNDFFDDNEIIFYKNIDDLSKKLSFYKNNDSLRIKIAKNGQRKYFDYFNSKIVSKYLIEKTFDINLKQKYLWDK